MPIPTGGGCGSDCFNDTGKTGGSGCCLGMTPFDVFPD
jgi:hypothetical protein